MRIIDVKNTDSIIESVRPKTNNTIRQQVLSIISDVQKRKDEALKEYETKFTGVKISSLKITQQEIKSAYSKVKKEQIAGIRIAKARLEKSENAVRKKLQDVCITIMEL